MLRRDDIPSLLLSHPADSKRERCFQVAGCASLRYLTLPRRQIFFNWAAEQRRDRVEGVELFGRISPVTRPVQDIDGGAAGT